MVITTKIKELQHFAKFNEIFVLSLLILFTNLAGKLLLTLLADRKWRESKGEKRRMRKIKKAAFVGMAFTLLAGSALTGCAGSGNAAGEQVILYTNADDEAVEAMKNALDSNGYEGKYIVQTFGTSELGGKLLAEGADIEADLVLSLIHI